MRAFISYCHKDTAALERLHVHLSNLKRDGLLETWYDREIPAGHIIDDEIDHALESAEVFLLLVSPDFIASEYCVGREMKRGLARRSEGAIVVPIILEPCDWQAMPALSALKALPTDGKPVSEWTNPNAAYLTVTTALRELIAARNAKTGGANLSSAIAEPQQRQAPARSEQAYRIRRDFTSIDKSVFADAAFADMRRYFKAAALELSSVEGIQVRFSDQSAQSFGCSVINRSFRNGQAHITVHRDSGNHLSDIYYSFSENARANTMNGGFNVANDGYEQFLSASFSMTFRTPKAQRLNSAQASEDLWSSFIAQAGLSVA